MLPLINQVKNYISKDKYSAKIHYEYKQIEEMC